MHHLDADYECQKITNKKTTAFRMRFVYINFNIICYELLYYDYYYDCYYVPAHAGIHDRNRETIDNWTLHN